MSADSHRTVTITRTSAGRYSAVNGRGSHDRLCTVSRTVKLGAPVATFIAP